MDDRTAAIRPAQEVDRSIKSQSEDTDTDYYSDGQYSDVEDDPFPFMRLPPEVRTMVYDEVLVASPSISIMSQYLRLPVHMGYSPPTTELLRASKTLYHEAIPIFYGHNTFDFEDLDALDGFLNKISIQQRRMITSIALRIRGTTAAKSVRLLQGCVSLRHLEVKVILSTLDGYYANRPGQPRAAGSQGLLDVRGIHELDVTLPELLYIWDDQQREALEEFKKALQVLKLPRSVASMRRQNAKDFPPEKAKRTVFGRANVMTRSERAALSKDSNQGYV
ncbi:MAG: hypothetical protein Q9171_006014 [Xanthocarpia ochracea]